MRKNKKKFILVPLKNDKGIKTKPIFGNAFLFITFHVKRFPKGGFNPISKVCKKKVLF